MRILFFFCLLFTAMTSHSVEIDCLQKVKKYASPLASAFLDNGVRPDSCAAARIEGTVVEGDAIELAEFFSSNPGVVYIYLNLVGGNVNESIRMGYIIREWSGMTWATGADTCASSCVLIWLGGVYRDAGEEHLKVHRFYMPDEEFRELSGEEVDEFYQFITSKLRQYLSDMGVEADQDELIRSIMTTPPQDLKVVTERTHARLFGLPTSRDQWFRSHGCKIEKNVESLACVTGVALRDRERAGLLPSQAD
jgi:hypothetical protein